MINFSPLSRQKKFFDACSFIYQAFSIHMSLETTKQQQCQFDMWESNAATGENLKFATLQAIGRISVTAGTRKHTSDMATNLLEYKRFRRISPSSSVQFACHSSWRRGKKKHRNFDDDDDFPQNVSGLREKKGWEVVLDSLYPFPFPLFLLRERNCCPEGKEENPPFLLPTSSLGLRFITSGIRFPEHFYFQKVLLKNKF